jgi:uncharacterized phage-associated protein
MSLYKAYTKEEIAKIGNAIIYLVENIPSLTKTKALKLMYIIEEFSVQKYGLPFFNLKFYVWQFGPVAEDLFIEFSDTPVLLKDYIDRKHSNGATIIKAKAAFNDDEFSDNEIEILELVVKKFKNFDSKEMVAYTHREHSLWHKTATENCVLAMLESEQLNKTHIEINFNDLIKDDDFKRETYSQHNEYLAVSRSLKM